MSTGFKDCRDCPEMVVVPAGTVVLGNVAEWVEDCYSSSRDALNDNGVPPTVDECARRVVKGGSWGTLAHNLRTAERIAYPATHRDDSIGIRVAKSLPASFTAGTP